MKQTVVLASGIFDLLHPGHLYFLLEAKRLGDKLVVVVASDKTVRRQGKRPLFSQADRLQLVQAIEFVDEAVIGQPGSSLASLKEVNPDIIALGYDQWPDTKQLIVKLRRLGFKGTIVRVGRYKDFSSSKLKAYARHQQGNQSKV